MDEEDLGGAVLVSVPQVGPQGEDELAPVGPVVFRQGTDRAGTEPLQFPPVVGPPEEVQHRHVPKGGDGAAELPVTAQVQGHLGLLVALRDAVQVLLGLPDPHEQVELPVHPAQVGKGLQKGTLLLPRGVEQHRQVSGAAPPVHGGKGKRLTPKGLQQLPLQALQVLGVPRPLRIRDQAEQDPPVGVAMGQPRHGGVHVLVQGVPKVRLRHVGFQDGGHRLAAHRVLRVLRIDQTGVVGSDGHTQGPQALLDLPGLRIAQGDHPPQHLHGGDPVRHLPAPVVPLGFRHVLPQFDVPVVPQRLHLLAGPRRVRHPARRAFPSRRRILRREDAIFPCTAFPSPSLPASSGPTPDTTPSWGARERTFGFRKF